MAFLFEDTGGNLNVDFLVGVVIFIGAFLYLISAIPSIFLPYETNSVDLGSVVYRTSCLLAEDPGWYMDYGTGVNGSAWEYEPLDRLARVGLAVGKKTPNVLHLDKISRFKSLPYVLSRDHLGLNNTMTYNYSLVIKEFIGAGVPHELLNISEPCDANSVESIDRIVTIREGEGLYYDNFTYLRGNQVYHSADGEEFLNVERHPCFDKTNVTVRLTDCVNSNGTYSGFAIEYYVGPYYDPSTLVPAIEGSEYYLYKNGTYTDSGDLAIEPFNKGDKIDIILDLRAIQSRYAAQGLNVSRIRLSTTMISGPKIKPFPYFDPLVDPLASTIDFEDYNVTNPNYRYFDEHGLMMLRVWQV